jgi:hypothetical protein
MEGAEMSEHSIEAISVDESKRLIALEQTIKQGLDTFVEVGEALLEIRDSRLYRIEHGTFEEYCKGKWGMSRFHAYNLINGSKATKNVDHGQHKPTTERQARPLTKLPPEDQPKAWQKAVEIAGNEQPTAKQVTQAVVEISKSYDKTMEANEEMLKLPKYKPDLAMQIVRNAMSMIDTIHKKDQSREQALRLMISYCNTQLNK